MGTASSALSFKPPNPTRQPARRLLFDRRYGWIYDEWKHPSEEALAGGRGMFCIIPITKSLINVLSLSINVAVNSVIKAHGKSNNFSPRRFQSYLCTQLHILAHSHAEMEPQVHIIGQGVFQCVGALEIVEP